MRSACAVVIVGGGFAGAATAFFLARRGQADVLLLERERLPGMHASGRNAALLVRPYTPLELDSLAEESARFLAAPPPPFEGPLLRTTGSLFTGRGPEWEELAREPRGIRLAPREARDRVPALDPGALDGALWSPEDGVVDVHALLAGYLEGARRCGVEIATGVAVIGLRTAGGRVLGVETSAGPVDASAVVNAAGAWAGPLGETAGLGLPLTPLRRHLAVTEPTPAVDPGWPIVWDLSESFYCRPESGGLLMSPCDEDPHPPADVGPTPDGTEMVASKAARLLPGLADLGLGRVWACLRTFAPDHRLVVGPDPRAAGLYWVAGLGGIGAGLSPAIGRLAAEIVHPSPGAGRPRAPLGPARLLA